MLSRQLENALASASFLNIQHPLLACLPLLLSINVFSCRDNYKLHSPLRLPISSQVDNIHAVEEKWKHISDLIGKMDPVDNAPVNAANGSDDAKRSAKETVLRRFREATEKWPKMLADERLFWQQHPDSVLTSPFPPGADHSGFVIQPNPRQPGALSEMGKWLLDVIDNPISDLCSSPIILPEQLRTSISSLHTAESEAAAPGGCKVARPDVQLYLHSDASKTRPVGRIAYNPSVDLSVGHIAIVMGERAETPGGRGWDLVEIINYDNATSEFQASRNSVCWVLLFC